MLPTLVLAGALASGMLNTPMATTELSAAAATSPRPAECDAGRGRSLVWRAARQPELATYCVAMAKAQATIGADPASAARAAKDADLLVGQRAAPQIMLGRAALALGDARAATEHFARARALDPHSLIAPEAIHDSARALASIKRYSDARRLYAVLVPRISLLGDDEERARVLVEAALVTMADESSKQAPSLDEAIAYLQEVQRRPPTSLRDAAALTLALAYDRDQRPEDAALALDRSSPHAARGPFISIPDLSDAAALGAMALEREDRAKAVRAWEAFAAAEGQSAAWAKAARARAQMLRSAPPSPTSGSGRHNKANR